MKAITLFLLLSASLHAQGFTAPFSMMKSGAVAPWTPLSVDSCVIWLDASDSTTITKDASFNISQWNDKSGYSNNVTATGSNSPQLKYGGLNGRTAVSITANRYMQPASYTYASRVLTVFAVAKLHEYLPANGSGRLVTMNQIPGVDYDAPGGVAIYNTGLTGISAYRNGALSTVSFTRDSVYILCSQFTGTNHTMYRNGSAGSTVASSTQFYARPTFLGYDGGGSFYGECSEIIMYQRSLTTQERLDVETYLKVKWGIAY